LVEAAVGTARSSDGRCLPGWDLEARATGAGVMRMMMVAGQTPLPLEWRLVCILWRRCMRSMGAGQRGRGELLIHLPCGLNRACTQSTTAEMTSGRPALPHILLSAPNGRVAPALGTFPEQIPSEVCRPSWVQARAEIGGVIGGVAQELRRCDERGRLGPGGGQMAGRWPRVAKKQKAISSASWPHIWPTGP
jgi:hypothetical protein